MTEPGSRLVVALVHDVFPDAAGPDRLAERLAAARDAGADLALLPELPLDGWVGSTREPRDADAEPPGGPRHRLLARAARRSGVAVQGGAIVVDPVTGRRFNRSLLLDATGELVATYDKLHLPSEPGFWESDHYHPGESPPRPVELAGFRLGLLICSDVQRPTLCNLLGLAGVELIAAPRATPPESYERWRTVLRADALTSATYLISVNRPAGRDAIAIGGPSVVVAPDGEVVLETTGPVATVALERSAVAAARADYPGYLAVRAGLYARAWASLAAAPPKAEVP